MTRAPQTTLMRASTLLTLALLAIALVACPAARKNHAPQAQDQVLTTPEDTPLDLTLDITDPDGDDLTCTITLDPTHGTLTGTPPDLTYTPKTNYIGADQFTYTTSDGDLTSREATVTITVTSTNDAPIAQDQSLTTPKDTALPITLTATDPDGDDLTYAIVQDPDHGTLTGTLPDVTYTPDLGYIGTDTFTYAADDGVLASALASVTIDVGGTNDPPTTLTLSDTSIAENQPAGTQVGVFTTTDPDQANRHTYTLATGDGDDDNQGFYITIDTLYTNTSFDHESTPTQTIRVRTKDTFGASLEAIFIIAIEDVNEPPGLESIEDRRMIAGDSVEIPLDATDETPELLTFTATSSDPMLVGDEDLEVLRSGSSYLLVIATGPRDHGTTTITVTVTDPENLEGHASFELHVVPPFHDPPLRLTASDGAARDYFGVSVALDRDTAVVGAWFDDDNGENSGSAYVFTRAQGVWREHAKLSASDGAAGDGFGGAVAVDGDTVVIGAHWDDAVAAISGSAYVFTRVNGAWIQQAKLTASDGAAGDAFGGAVAVDGDTLVIGASSDVHGDREAMGSAYVFTRVNGAWSQQAKLTASDGTADDHLGRSVALDGDTAVIGLLHLEEEGLKTGTAYVFTRVNGAWSQQAKLTASDGPANNLFGADVAVDGDTAVIGAQTDGHDGMVSAGSAYVFRRVDRVWSQEAKLTASDGAEGDGFGTAVALAGNTVLIGASVATNDSERSGSTYVFTRSDDEWIEQAKLTASHGHYGARFGCSVGTDGSQAIVGAHRENVRDVDPGMEGAAYLFVR